MAKASLKLPNGTVVTLEGTPKEIKHLLELYGGDRAEVSAAESRTRRRKPRGDATTGGRSKKKSEATPNLTQIVNLVKNCDEAEAIETQILDRTAQVDRTLLGSVPVGV